MALTRRALLAGSAAFAGTAALAQGPARSMRPVLRPVLADRSAQLIAGSGLSGDVGFVVADAANGALLEGILPDRPLPPASVTKVVTSCYGLTALGRDHRFFTRVFADGPLENGILNGNLILVGGGDPTLVTDQLAELAISLKETGLREVRGDFLIWDEAMVNLHEIDTTQLDYAGYNPAISGLNLNFNRVHFEWKREGADYAIALDARSDSFRPAVTIARVQVADREVPVFTYRADGLRDIWTVARGALNAGGSRWLPVRQPGLYAGEVFATFARSHGIVLRPPRETKVVPTGQVLATFSSAPLPQILREMLRYSTNLTAEAVGMAATRARAEPTGNLADTLAASAGAMAGWMRGGSSGAPVFVDHSGLGDTSRLSAVQMVRWLVTQDIQRMLHPMLKTIPLVDENGRLRPDPRGVVQAKTGTLNFVSSLAGYLDRSDGRRLAFAFFGADLQARAAGKRQGDEQPRGARSWNTRAKRLQQALLQHWVQVPLAS